MIISFVGHARISERNKIQELLKEQIRHIRKNTDTRSSLICYLGGYGEFNEICAFVCNELKKEIGGIETVYVTPYITLSQAAKIEEMQKSGLYDISVYPPIEKTPPKYAISKRNEWMMANADLVIAYINHSYGGAYKSFEFAKRKKKKIINIYELL